MSDLNRIASLILGLVVIVLLFAVVTGKINLKGKNILSLGSKTNVTGTVTPTPKTVVIQKTAHSDTYRPYNASPTPKPNSYNANKFKTISTIPSTGSPTELLPIMTSLLFAGVYLRRKS